MELKVYLRALWRRWPIILIVPLIVGCLSVFQESVRDTTYSTHAKLRIISEQLPGDFTSYPLDDNFVASEFAIDDMVAAVRGNVFAAAVAERVRGAGLDVSGGDVQSAMTVTREHRVLTVNFRSTDAQRAEIIAREATAELEESAFDYIGVSSPEENSIVRVIDYPGGAGPDTSRARLLLILQLIVAVGAGVLLAYLVDYLDDSLHDGEQAAAVLRAPLLASVLVERRT